MRYKYILDGRTPIEEVDLLKWAEWLEKADRRVAQTVVNGDVEVSTVFLGLNHNWGDGPPLLFETMVFGGEHDGYQQRYSTWQEAEEGHRRVVEMVKGDFDGWERHPSQPGDLVRLCKPGIRMSTNYYQLKWPITQLEVESQNPTHTRLKVWVGHGLSGTLIVPTIMLDQVVSVFANLLGPAPIVSYWGGSESGTQVTEFKALPDNEVMVSEYGDLLTIAQIKARQGAKRQDGYPTELFGYEEVTDAVPNG